MDTIAEPGSLPELPVAESDTIVVGEVQAVTSHFTPGQKAIYSEYRIRLQDILKAQSTPLASAVSKSGTLDIVDLGGAVMTADGKVYRVVAKGHGAPIEKNGQYLFFLTSNLQAECFRIVRLWEFQAGKAVAMAREDRARKATGKSTVADVDYASLIKRVRELVRGK